MPKRLFFLFQLVCALIVCNCVLPYYLKALVTEVENEKGIVGSQTVRGRAIRVSGVAG